MSRLCSSIPKKRGAARKPWSSKKKRRLWTNAALPFSGLRTVFPTRTIPGVSCPPRSGISSGASFCSSFFFSPGLLFGDIFGEKNEIPKGISDTKFFESPGLGHQGGLNRIRWEILLIQCFNVGHTYPTDGVALGRSFGRIQVQSDPISLDNGKRFVLIRWSKAELLIKSQGLLQILYDKSGSN